VASGSEDGHVSVDTWRDECKAAGMIRQNQHRVLEALVDRGEITVDQNELSLPQA